MADYTDGLLQDVPQTESYPCGAGPEDQTDPEVTIISPAAGSVIPRNATIIFDVTDNFALREVVVWVSIAGAWEVIWGGNDDGFSPGYELSTRANLTYGFRFTVIRNGGWPSSPTFRVKAIDRGGNQAQ